MLLTDLAHQTFQELDKPSDLSVGAIKYWLVANIGLLNARLRGEYTINVNYEATPELGENEGAIFKQIYYVYYWDKKLRGTLGAASLQSVVEIASDGARVRSVSKTDISKVYLQAKRDAIEELGRLVMGYNINATTPLAVHGNDTIEGIYNSPVTDTRDLT